MVRYNKDMKKRVRILSNQINSLAIDYSAEKLSQDFKYRRFQDLVNRIRSKIQTWELKNGEKEELMKRLDYYYSKVNRQLGKHAEDYKAEKEQEKEIKKKEEAKQTSQPSELEKSVEKPAEKAGYERKGRGKAAKNYRILMNKVSGLENYCKKLGSKEFSPKEFYKKLHDIEDIFLYDTIHGDDSKYLWEIYKPIKERVKEALRKESKNSKSRIEEIVQQGIADLEKDERLDKAHRIMNKAFSLFNQLSLTKEDREECSKKIEELKSAMRAKTDRYEKEFQEYMNSALNLLREAKSGSPHEALDDINDFRIEFRMSGIAGFKKYSKKINETLKEARHYALSRKAEDKKKRESTKVEKLMTWLKDQNENRKRIISRVEREIAMLKSDSPFDLKIIEKQDFIKELKSQIEQTERKLRQLDASLDRTD